MAKRNQILQFDHFIPVSTSGLIKRLADNGLDEKSVAVIQQIRQLLSYQFSERLIELKKQYQPFDPDRELLDGDNQSAQQQNTLQAISDILTKANYIQLDQTQIEEALLESSPYGLEVKIDFDAFSHISLFYRGKAQTTLQVRDWKKLWLKRKPINELQYQRLLLLLSYQDSSNKPGIYLKLFKNILQPDLEMLFPDCRIRMKKLDKLKLAITGGGGTAGGLFATISKISAAINPWTIVIAVTGFAALLWRQISKIFIQKTRYMMTLAQNLYFKNMDNNSGAITYLLDQARQEEIKETILAYALIKPKSVDTLEKLDDACEQWFMDQFGQGIDFDIEDALDKLKALNIIEINDNIISCANPDQISDRLEKHWQAFFSSTTSRSL